LWTLLTANAGWSARYGHTMVQYNDGSLVLMGGNEGSNAASAKRDVWRSTNHGQTWTQQTGTAGWSARWFSSSVTVGSNIILTGGYNGTTALKDVWRSGSAGATWQIQNTSPGWVGKWGHSSLLMPDGSIIVMGGTGTYPNYYNDVWQSQDSGITWSVVNASAGWSPRSFQSGLALPNGSVAVIAGITGSGVKNDTWIFNPTSSTAQNPVHTYPDGPTYGTYYSAVLMTYNVRGYSSAFHQFLVNGTQVQPTVVPTMTVGYLSYDGYVKDAESANIIVNATVTILENSINITTTTNESGYYFASDYQLASGSPITIVVSAAGHETYRNVSTPIGLTGILRLNHTLMSLTPASSGETIGGIVRMPPFNQTLDGATIVIRNETYAALYSVTTNGAGYYVKNSLTSGYLYDVWGSKSGLVNSTIYEVRVGVPE
jgi:hypothetical protein